MGVRSSQVCAVFHYLHFSKLNAFLPRIELLLHLLDRHLRKQLLIQVMLSIHRTTSPVCRLTAFRTDPNVPSPSCLVTLYRFILALRFADRLHWKRVIAGPWVSLRQQCVSDANYRMPSSPASLVFRRRGSRKPIAFVLCCAGQSLFFSPPLPSAVGCYYATTASLYGSPCSLLLRCCVLRA